MTILKLKIKTIIKIIILLLIIFIVGFELGILTHPLININIGRDYLRSNLLNITR
jgi:hypothetical protein